MSSLLGVYSMRGVMLGLLCALQWSIWCGVDGFSQYQVMHNELLRRQKETVAARKLNQDMAKDIEQSQSITGLIERNARERLHMIKPGETLYINR